MVTLGGRNLSDDQTENWIIASYRGLLGREPDQSGLRAHLRALNDGLAPEDLLRRMVGSAEFRQTLLKPAPHCDEERYYFVHVPKTAGLSVREYLREAVDSKQLFPGVFPVDLLRSQTPLATFTYFSGHLLGFLDKALGAPTRKAVLLRDPVERCISHFRHIKRDPTLQHHQAVQSMDLATALTKPDLSGFASNFQARYLWALQYDQYLVDHSVQLRADEPDELALLDNGLRVLKSMDVIGVSEQHGTFLDNLAESWSLPKPNSEFRINQAVSQPSVNQQLRETLEQKNQVDRALHSFALERLPGPVR